MYGKTRLTGSDIMRFQQDDRLIQVSTALDPEPFVVKRFEGADTVSAPFFYQAELMSADARLELKQMVGQPIGFRLETDGEIRYFHGYVKEFARVATNGDLTQYRVVVAPWFAFLKYASNCRIFQDRSVLEIVDDVFAPYGDLAVYRHDLRAQNYASLSYCVQYNESDFDFVSRLLEDAGIYYTFAHDEQGHTLLLGDDSPNARPVGNAATIRFRINEGGQDDYGLDKWAARRSVGSGVHTLKSFDFKQPRSALSADHITSIPLGLLPNFERYQYDGAARFKNSRIGDALAGIRGEASIWPTKLFEGSGITREIYAGGYFVLEGHYDHAEPDSAEREFFVVEVRHTATNNFTTDFAGEVTAEYACALTALRRKISYRPLRKTPRQLMPGPQTATVVGPAGEEIYADRYGRVKVQFHWDRLGQFDDASSCWIRVASPWAGSDMGGVSPPRIGQEVIVDFLDGDPDRPIIINRVYNEDNMPPFGEEISGLKSKTIKGEGYNEITMHDRAGAELLNTRAQRDMTTYVGNNQSCTITNNQNITIGNHQTIEVDGDQSITVSGNQSIDIGGDQVVGIAGNRTFSVSGNNDGTIAGESTLMIDGSHTATVQGAVAQTYASGQTKTIESAGYTETISGDYARSLAGNFNNDISGNYNEHITEACVRVIDGGVLDRLNHGRIAIVQKYDKRTVEGPVTDSVKGWLMSSSTTIRQEADELLEISSADQVLASVGGTSISIKKGKIVLSAGGSKVVISGDGVQVLGALVRLNC